MNAPERCCVEAIMTMSERDYILRLVQRLAQTIASILGRARGGQTADALAAIDRARLDLFGPLRRSLDILDASSVMSLLGDVDRVRAYAMLATAEAEVRDMRGELKQGAASRRRALEVYLEIALRRGSEISREDRSAILDLAARVDASRLPSSQRDALDELRGA